MTDRAVRAASDAGVGGLEHQRFELALQAAGLGEYEWNIAQDIFIVSERLAAISGIPAGRLPAENGQLLYKSIHPDDVDSVRDEVRSAVARDGRFDVTYRRIRPDDGRTIWMQSCGLLVRDSKGEPERFIGVMRDVTETKHEEDARETLMSEVDHRVKNVLAAVQSLAAQTAKRTTSMDAFLSTFAGRLKAMASAQELLTAARWRGAAVGHIAAAELGGIAPGQTRWSGPELFLSPRAANALSLALHELATNAVKFGALSTPNGRVDVRWRKRGEGGFELLWTESGGPSVNPPTRRGFGTTLLDQVTGRELGGETSVEYRRDGVVAKLNAGEGALVERPDVVPSTPQVQMEPAADAPRGAPGRPDLSGLKVLIVEDAVLLALELESGLSEAGAEIVGPAYELSEAMGLVENELDAAVLDANLNGESVMPAAEILARRGIPFVFATGYGETKGAPIGFDAPIVRKPYDVMQVAQALAEVVGRA